jgi:5-methylcytosine-specific restriction endonuclease McrA
MPRDNYYNTARYLRWREKVLRRAKYLCQECARYGIHAPATTAHHILPIKEFPDKRYNLKNGAALCNSCHNKAHPEKGGDWR